MVYEALMLPDTSLSSVDAMLYLRDIYSDIMGFYSISTSNNPLDSVGYYPQESITDDSLEDKRIRTYMELEIHKNVGMSLVEYLNQPSYIIDKINKIANDVINIRNKKIGEGLGKLGIDT